MCFCVVPFTRGREVEICTNSCSAFKDVFDRGYKEALLGQNVDLQMG